MESSKDKTRSAGGLSHADEYKMLREEILQHMESLSRTQIWGVLGVSAVYTWLFTHRDKLDGPWRYAWFIAPVIMAACALLNAELTWRICHIAKYLHQIENLEFSDNSKAHGWEHYKLEHPSSNRFGDYLGASLWLVGFLGSLIISWLLFSQPNHG